jgi:hypothetical protein
MNFKRLLPLIIVAPAFLMSCGENATESKPVSGDTTVVIKKAGEGEIIIIDTQAVPSPVKTTFVTKYAKAKDVKWASYKPVPADTWEMDKDYYYVTYEWDYIPYGAWYTADGTILKEEEKIYLANSGDMPTAIVRSIMQQYPGYEIVEIDKENDKDMEMYEVELRNGDKKAKVKFLMNGEIFKAK